MHRTPNQAARLLLLLCLVILFPAGAFPQDYMVQAGDTIYSISRRFGLTPEELMSINGIEDPRNLRVGQILQTENSTTTVETSEYTVLVGDTLYSIARRFDISVEDLQAINNLLNSTSIKAGQQLLVPLGVVASTAGATNTPDPTETTTGTNNSENTNSGGDTTSDATDTRTPIAREGTILVSTPASGGENIFWPLEGDRYAFNGKFPGLVIKGDTGAQVRAVSAGLVVYSGPHSSLGKVVFIQNARGYIYIYGGNSEVYVAQGQEILAGDIIGAIGPVPLLPDVQAYFSVWKDRSYIDPNIAPR